MFPCGPIHNFIHISVGVCRFQRHGCARESSKRNGSVNTFVWIVISLPDIPDNPRLRRRGGNKYVIYILLALRIAAATLSSISIHHCCISRIASHRTRPLNQLANGVRDNLKIHLSRNDGGLDNLLQLSVVLGCVNRINIGTRSD